MKKLLFLLLSLSVFNAQSQIVVDNTSPYDDPVWMTNNILIGGGVSASNINYQGDSCQIGFFNAINTSLGIDSGIVLCTGDVNDLDPASPPTFPFISNVVVDPDLLAVANSVPGMIGQSFSVSSVNDIAILEFDFIPTSDSLSFRYAFGSQEYFAFENTQYNDVFGFFLSGPGIAGPWSNGAVNLAYIPNTNPQMPITISSVNSVTPINQQYFVDNQNGLDTIADADGYTTVFTAQALVQCGSTYHIKLAIADGSDSGLSSYVWLESGSFSSPELHVYDNLGIDSTVMDIACGADIILTANLADSTATFEWFDSTSVVFSTDSFVSVGTGSYVVAATINGCTFFSDTLEVISEAPDSLPPPVFDCASVSDTLVYVDWLHPLGATTSTHYYIFGALNVGGPYYNVADVYYPTDSYILNENSMPFGTNHYFVTTSSECFETVNSDTISPMRFNISSLDVNCWDDTDGIINVGVDDYINVLQYSFSIDGDLNTNAFPMDTVFTGVSAGSHIITVDDVTSGCVIDIPVTISAPGFPLQALVDAQTLNLCFGDTTALAIGSAAGGTPDAISGYSYEWFEFGNPQSFSTSDTALGLSAGSYILEVMDANGCDTFASVN
ncbi:MAG: choice-of-anchor L domain-containing protein, partial [Flavobacteriales bacterium]|nr:choice-of-anchor L domain-containing protein [Flavobacteriales bacterium]